MARGQGQDQGHGQSLEDFPLAESTLNYVRLRNKLRAVQYQAAWRTWANDRSDNPKINERDKKFRPRKICLLGCCLTMPRDTISMQIINTATGFVRNLARLCRGHQKESKGHLAFLIAFVLFRVLAPRRPPRPPRAPRLAGTIF